MNHKQYKDFHEKFTRENQFEFSYGIYLARDFVRGREVNNKILKDFFRLLKITLGVKLILNYLLNKNKSKLFNQTIIYIESKIK